jgi:hypothetical protein
LKILQINTIIDEKRERERERKKANALIIGHSRES